MNRLASLLAAAAIAFAGATSVSAQTFSEPQRGEIEKIIKEYLIKHPEVLQEAIAELEKRQAVAEAEGALGGEEPPGDLHSPRQVNLGSPQGYHLRGVLRLIALLQARADDMSALLAKDPKLKVVLGVPVLGRARPSRQGRGRGPHTDKTGKIPRIPQKMLTRRDRPTRRARSRSPRRSGSTWRSKDLKSDGSTRRWLSEIARRSASTARRAM